MGKEEINMEHSIYYQELIKKTAHRYPNKIKQIYLASRKLLEQYIAKESASHARVSKMAQDIILPSIAIYLAVKDQTGDVDKAYEIVGRTYEDYYEEKAEKLKKACRNPLAFHFVPSLAADFIKKNYDEMDGFKTINKSKGMKMCHIDVVKCPFDHYCRKYGCEELTTAFCDAADMAFDHLRRGISWDRTQAIGRGDDRCDFIITID